MLITPPSIEFNELTLLKIKVNMMRESLIERLYNITNAEDSNSMIDGIHNLMADIDDDSLEETLSHFNRPVVLSMLPGVLSEMHYGDCTGCPCSCDRCYFERLAEDSTVTWGKAQGNETWYKWYNVNKKGV